MVSKMGKENKAVLRKTFDVIGAFVFIIVKLGLEDQVLEDIKTIEGVEEAYLAYGVYDLVIRMKVDSIDKLKEILTHRFRAIKNIKSTLSLILTGKNGKKIQRQDFAPLLNGVR